MLSQKCLVTMTKPSMSTTKINPQSTVCLEKLTTTKIVKTFFAFIKLEGLHHIYERQPLDRILSRWIQLTPPTSFYDPTVIIFPNLRACFRSGLPLQSRHLMLFAQTSSHEAIMREQLHNCRLFIGKSLTKHLQNEKGQKDIWRKFVSQSVSSYDLQFIYAFQ